MKHESHVNELRCEGYLVRRPELRHTGTGRAVTNLTLRTKRINFDGEPAQAYLDFVAWGRTAEHAADLPEGSLVFVIGRLGKRKDRDDKWQTEATALRVVEIGPAEERTEAPSQYDAPMKGHERAGDGPPPHDDKDQIPF